MDDSWRYSPRSNKNEQGAQIDLIFDRSDDAITVCEIKYTDKPFIVDKDFADRFINKLTIFKKVTRTKKQLFTTLISANGIKANKYSEEILNNVIVLEDLFKNFHQE